MEALAPDSLSADCLALALDLKRAGVRLISDRKDDGKARLMILSPAPISLDLRRRMKAHCEELCGAIERGLQ